MSYLARGQKRPVRVSDDPNTTLLGIKTLLIHCTVRTYEKWKRKLPKDIIYCTVHTYEKWKRKLPKDI